MNLSQPELVSRWKHWQRSHAFSAVADWTVEMFCWPSRFADPAVERDFTVDFGQRFADFRRAAIILGTLVWICFGWWEINLARSSAAFRPYFVEIFAFRCIGAVAACVVIVLTFRPSFRDDATAHRVMLTTMAVMYVCMLAQTFLAPRPFNFTHFFVGFYLILFFQFGFLRLRAKRTFLVSLCAVAAILLGQLLTQAIEPTIFAAGMFYISNVLVVGYSVNVNAEKHARDRFISVQALAHSNAALQDANTELAQKHRDLERARRDQQTKSDALIALREQQKEDADHASQAKSRFLAAAAHDLRQPMHALNLFLAAADEALARHDVSESTTLIGEARKASALTVRLFNAILDLSKLESGHVIPNYTSVDLGQVVDDAVDQLTPFAASCGVSLRCRRACGRRAFVRSDADWVPRVLGNLISNSIKYSDPQKARRAVIVGVVKMPNYVRIDVVDNGIGIASQHWDEIFQPFVQLGNPERDREKGLGLGLSIVNAVMSLLEGHRIELSSIEGRGSRFSIRLPVAELTASFDVIAPPAAPELSPATLRGVYVLLVEDDRLVRASMEALFAQWGVLCDSAGSLGDLDELLSSIERLPDLVISDYRLPEMSTALDVVELLKRKLSRPVPCLVITGEAGVPVQSFLPERCLLGKPLVADALAARMVELVGKRNETA